MKPPIFLGDLAVILAEGGRRNEALKQIEANLARFPSDVWVAIVDSHIIPALVL